MRCQLAKNLFKCSHTSFPLFYLILGITRSIYTSPIGSKFFTTLTSSTLHFDHFSFVFQIPLHPNGHSWGSSTSIFFILYFFLYLKIWLWSKCLSPMLFLNQVFHFPFLCISSSTMDNSLCWWLNISSLFNT